MVRPGPGFILSAYGLDNVRRGEPYFSRDFLSRWQVTSAQPTAYKIYGMNFSPYVDGRDPNLGTEITGAWLSADRSANDQEIANLISEVNAGQVDLAMVGSEVLPGNRLSLSDVNLGSGSWQIHVQDSAGSSAHSAGFTEQASPPTVTGYSWTTSPRANQNFNGTITGTNFVTGGTQVFFCVNGSSTCYQQPAAGVTVNNSSDLNVSNANLGSGFWQIHFQPLAGSSARSVAFSVQASVPIATGYSLATTDVCGKLLGHPAVIVNSDVVLPNYYPYWEGMSSNTSMATLHRQHQLIVAAAQGKPAIVSETGWPSAGNVIFNAVSSPANANFYFLNFVSWAPANNVSYSNFDALDEAWKANHGEGPQGAHWGVWDKDGLFRSSMPAGFDGQTMADNWTSAGVPGGAGTPSVECAYVPPSLSSNNLFGQVFHVNTDDYKVAVYIHVGDWWTKPTFANPLTSIGLDGSWERDITTGGNDPLATQIVAYLVPKTFNPPAMLGGQTLPPTLDQNAVANTQIQIRNFVALRNYIVALSASPAAGGTVSGGVTFASGSLRTVTATANSGYTFANWTENGSVVSSSANYVFTLSNNRNLAYEAKESLSNRDQALRIKVLESGGTSLEVQSTDDQESSASTVLLPTRPVKVSIVDSGGSQLSILTSVSAVRSDEPAVELRKGARIRIRQTRQLKTVSNRMGSTNFCVPRVCQLRRTRPYQPAHRHYRLR
jgi:exo-beta-1,3-glucanase (GH17 family)